MTEGAGEDNHEAVIGLDLLDNDTEPGQFQVLGDSAYGAGDPAPPSPRLGHTAIIKPLPLRPAVRGGFILDDFTIDEAAGTATCGHRRQITERLGHLGAGCDVAGMQPGTQPGDRGHRPILRHGPLGVHCTDHDHECWSDIAATETGLPLRLAEADPV
jgi:hypothetical protein